MLGTFATTAKGLLTTRMVGVAARLAVMRSEVVAWETATTGLATPPVQVLQVAGSNVPVVSTRFSVPPKVVLTLPKASVAVTTRPKPTPAVWGSLTGPISSAATAPEVMVICVLSDTPPSVPVTGQVPATVAESTFTEKVFPPPAAQLTSPVASQPLPKTSVATAV